MQRFISCLISAAMAAGSLAAHAADDARAAQLLAQAREAIGGEKALAKVQGLSGAGTVTRAMGDRQVTGEVTIDLQLPDKMLRVDSISPMGDSATVVQEQGINGDTLLRFSRILNMPPGAMIRTPPPPAPGSDAEAQALRNSRAELARMAIAMLLTAPTSTAVDFTHGGEAESPDGKADVIDLKGDDGFVAKLLLDKATHRPLMLAYRGVSPRVVVQTRRGAPPPAAAQGDAGHGRGEPGLPRPELVDINMFVDDYRTVAGVSLPHRISRAVDGQTTEELTFKTITVNPSFRADTFAKK